MTFEEFCAKVMAEYSKPENLNWRYGQITFNILAQERPDLSEEIRGTEMDPFYTKDPEKIANFYNWLAEAWEKSDGYADACYGDSQIP